LVSPTFQPKVTPPETTTKQPLKVKQQSINERWASSGLLAGSQPTGDGLVINPVVGCSYFLPGPRLPSQLKSTTAPWPVANYTAW